MTVAVDGKTSQQGYDAQGDPIHMLKLFPHDAGLRLTQFPFNRLQGGHQAAGPECSRGCGKKINATGDLVRRPSADEIGAAKLMGGVKGHWDLKNRLHFVKDRWWDEDRQ